MYLHQTKSSTDYGVRCNELCPQTPFRFRTTCKVFAYIGILAVLLLLNFSKVDAAPDSKGTDFWLMFNSNLSTPTLTLFITSDVNTSGVVEGPAFSAIPFTVAANTVTSVVVPAPLASHETEVIDNKGIHVTALNEVTVYGLNYVQFTTDAFLGLPKDVLGRDYLVMTYKNSGIVNANQVGIVGTVNGTTVTITPSVAVGAHPAGVAYNIILNQGQTYQLVNTNAAPSDLTGTSVSSDQPVGVFGASQCANIPSESAYCDHICEMLPPTTTWGKKFVTVPLASRSNGDTWRIMASENGTVVTINGIPSPPVNRGQFIEQILTTSSIIESNKPVLVVQFSNGSAFSGNPGDPFMMIVPPFEQFLASYTLTTVSGYTSHYMNVVAPNSIVGSMTLDGVSISATSFNPIGGSGFSGAQLPVSPGNHTLIGSLPFGVFQYGFTNDDSYGYPGGQAFGQIAMVRSLDLVPSNGGGVVNTQACFNASVADQNSSPLEGIRVDFDITGANPQKAYAYTDITGKALFCYIGSNQGNDAIDASSGSLTDASSFLWNGVPQPPIDPYLGCHCGNGHDSLRKVKIAHMTNSKKNSCNALCIDTAAIGSHILHGDVVCGTCPSLKLTAGDLESIEITPNPSFGIFIVRFAYFEHAKITVTDMVGRVVKLMNARQTTEAAIDLSGSAKGLYYVEVDNGVERLRTRVLVN